jgi:hypothetical protein
MGVGFPTPTRSRKQPRPPTRGDARLRRCLSVAAIIPHAMSSLRGRPGRCPSTSPAIPRPATGRAAQLAAISGRRTGQADLRTLYRDLGRARGSPAQAARAGRAASGCSCCRSRRVAASAAAQRVAVRARVASPDPCSPYHEDRTVETRQMLGRLLQDTARGSDRSQHAYGVLADLRSGEDRLGPPRGAGIAVDGEPAERGATDLGRPCCLNGLSARFFSPICHFLVSRSAQGSSASLPTVARASSSASAFGPSASS